MPVCEQRSAICLRLEDFVVEVRKVFNSPVSRREMARMLLLLVWQTSLPPHRLYDCAIDLLLGTTPPRGCLYSLSGPKNKAMEEYIEDSLAAGRINHSASPVG
jgi:hypothetical protein